MKSKIVHNSFNLLGILILFFSSWALYGEPEIYLSHPWQKIQYPEIFHLAENYDVILLGEEHDDTNGHNEKLKLIHFINKNSERKIVLGLEMLEKDKQDTVNEFLQDIISHSSFFQSIQPNNIKAYVPILSYAKKENIPVIATNAPRKYVNIVSRKGLEGLSTLQPQALKYLPPIYLIQLFKQKEYEEKVKQAFSFHGHNVQMEKMMMAMYVWDTAMADSIAQTIPFKDKLFIHINGRYHSDEGFGISNRLKKIGFKVLTISMIPLKSRSTQDAKYADIIYYTGD